jgi:hypothetical protein
MVILRCASARGWRLRCFDDGTIGATARSLNGNRPVRLGVCHSNYDNGKRVNYRGFAMFSVSIGVLVLACGVSDTVNRARKGPWL